MEERLPEGWIEVPLHDIADLIRGVSYAKSLARDYKTENYLPLLRATNIQNEHLILDHDLVFVPKDLILDEQLLSLEDIVICMSSGSRHLVGKTAQLLQEWRGSFGTFCSVARFSQMINRRFFGYFFSSSRYRNFISDKSSGININNLRHADLEGMILRLPPLPEQDRIVAAIEQQFTRIDNAVASLQHAREKARQYRASLLQSAVGGELTKEWRAEHSASETGEQLLRRILAERRARWEEEQLAKMREKGITPKDDRWKQEYKEPQGPNVEDLPELPEGWCWAAVEQICDQIVDCLHSTPKFIHSGYLCIDTNCIKPGKILLEKARYVDYNTFFERNRRMKPQANDVIFSREGALLGVAVRVPESVDFCLGQRMMAFRLHPAMNAKYYEIVLNSVVFRTQYRSKITGTASPHLNIEDIRGFAIPLPSSQEQNAVALVIEQNLSVIDSQEENIEHNLKRAERERQSILQEAFAGRLVPQDPNDEPASVLLERIREERKRREEAEKVTRASRKGSRMKRIKTRPTVRGENGQQEIDLYQTLVEAGKPLAPDDLFKGAGLKTDEQPESTEVFYAELHTDVADGWIRETRPDNAHVLLEAVESPPGELTDTEEDAGHAGEMYPARQQQPVPVVRESAAGEQTHTPELAAQPQPPDQRSETLRQTTLWDE